MIHEGGARSVDTARRVTRGAIIVLGASLPISAAFDNILLVLILLSWLAAGNWGETFRIVRNNPVGVIACIWIVVHALGAVYSTGYSHDVTRGVRKASTFLLIPIALSVMQDPIDRDRAFMAFLIAIALTVVLSSVRWAGAIPADFEWLKPADYSRSVVFKFHLTQNLLVAFGAFVFAVHALRVRNLLWRRLFIVCAGLCAINVDFIGDGRTGQIALFVLIVFFGAWHSGRRGALVAFAAAAALTVLAYATPGSSLHKRTAVIADETALWQAGENSTGSSTGQRLEFYGNTLSIISKHPIAGVGVGGFPAAYEKEVSGTGLKPTQNPHGEYLLKATELGVIGLCMMLALFWTCWTSAPRLTRPHEQAIARAIVVTIGVASVVSSTFSDHTESLLFVWATGVVFAGLRPDSREDLRDRHRAR
jgi:O-antigen ligase